MVNCKLFILEDLPKSAVVNSEAYGDSKKIDNFINNAISTHISSMAGTSNYFSSVNLMQKTNVDSAVKTEENRKSPARNISNLNVNNKQIDIEAIKKTEYERGVRETEVKYQALLLHAKEDRDFTVLLEKKLNSIIPEKDLNLKIAKVFATSVSGIAKKLHLILKADFEKIISDGLIAQLNNFYKEGYITLTIHPERYDHCSKILQAEHIPDRFKNNFNIVKDAKIGVDDCHLEWQDTKLKYNQEQLSQEIDKIIEQLKTAN